MNAACFPIVASYLHLKGLRENARMRRAGEGRRAFATKTAWAEFSLHSARYEDLGAMFSGSRPGRAGEATA